MKYLHKINCNFCSQPFSIDIRHYNKNIKSGYNFYCSRKCGNLFRSKRTTLQVNCLQCGNNFYKYIRDVNKTKNNFCSRSCAATYNNTHKTKGTRRSKLEVYLEEHLIIFFPEFKILFNDKTTINSELDIFIPSLNLAFELNGIFHYEPIYGSEKLAQIQNNDSRKFQACLENNISLCIIDTSSFTNFKPLKAKKYLDIIINVINSAKN